MHMVVNLCYYNHGYEFTMFMKQPKCFVYYIAYQILPIGSDL